MSHALLIAALLGLPGCSGPSGTEPPADGWANTGPTVVEQVIDRGATQLLSVRQGPWKTWVEVPNVGAAVGDYVLLGKGSARRDVEISEIGQRVSEVVDIANVQVVDGETARRTISASAPKDAVTVQTVYAELDQRVGKEIVIYGTVVKATSAAGSIWVHVQDGTGDSAIGTHDLMVQTRQSVARGQQVVFRGVLRKNVDLGFGYRYAALVEEAALVEPAR